MTQQRFFVPEVMQTSALDCGPAALKSLLNGFGITASYGRLREACQTDIDGTSISAIETTAVQLGLDAKQVMLPLDHLLLQSAGALPAMCVVRLPSGLTHFVVAWNRLGAWVQLMDPATGRRWVRRSALERDLYQHTHRVRATAWRDWAGGDEFRSMTDERLRNLGMDSGDRRRAIHAALADCSWRSLGALDAAIRMARALVSAKAVRHGAEAVRLVQCLVDLSDVIPGRYWSVRPSSDKDDCLMLRGAVLLRVRGRREPASSATPLSAELRAALNEQPPVPARELFHMMLRDGAFAPGVVVGAVAISSTAPVFEAMLWRSLLDLNHDLSLTGQRIVALTAGLAFFALLLTLEWSIASRVLRLGRQLETRFREALLYRIPRLPNRYFRSRLVSDMAERSHNVHQLRQVPDVTVRFLRASLSLLATVIGVSVLYPASAWLAVGGAIAAIALPVAAQQHLAERDMRVRSRVAALARFYLDALVGATMIRAHGAAPAMRRENGMLLGEWAQATLDGHRSTLRLEMSQLALSLVFAGAAVALYVARAGDPGGVLLLAYWMLTLPMLGDTAARAAAQYPRLRNIAVRLLEPLNAPTGFASDDRPRAASSTTEGVSIVMHDVSARSAGHTILRALEIHIAAGEHVAIVGKSGAGKSSFVALLLGWLRPASGAIVVDGATLDDQTLAHLRTETVWIDATVQIWNRSLFDNITYGSRAPELDIGEILDASMLRDSVHRLSMGLRTRLGEAGSLLSGGEAQRVRIARGMARRRARLVILDEPARGLDRARRSELMDRCRARWPDATLLCVTHDIGEAFKFDRVLVMQDGRIVESGPAGLLAANPQSALHTMLMDSDRAWNSIWRDARWRRLVVQSGTMRESRG